MRIIGTILQLKETVDESTYKVYRALSLFILFISYGSLNTSKILYI